MFNSVGGARSCSSPDRKCYDIQFLHLRSLVVLLCSLLAARGQPPTVYPVKEYWHNVTLDHFSYAGTQRSFPLRFFVNDEHLNRGAGGPILFYTGNEGPIESFINNTGLVFELAPQLGALIVFAEHRYYGSSLPFGSASGAPGNIDFLTVEQALADFSELLVHIRLAWQVPEETACIALGGSYGANLAYWWRARQPNLVAGALAASATPQKHLLRESNGFARIWTDVYRNVSESCPRIVYAGFLTLQQKAQTFQGRQEAARILGLCNSESGLDFDDVYDWLVDGLETMVQYGYSYPTSFYNPVPGSPYRVACQAMLKNSQEPLRALTSAAQVYYNYTGQAGPCFNLGPGTGSGIVDRVSPRQRAVQTSSRAMALDAWGYQTCTEVYQPMPTKGLTGGDMMLPSEPNKTAYFENCMTTFGVAPRPNWEEMWFWGSSIRTLTNVFFTNGQLDPWRAGGIVDIPKGTVNPDSIQIRLLEGAPHHMDLRASNPLDPPSVTAVRQEELEAMKRWAAEWRTAHLPPSFLKHLEFPNDADVHNIVAVYNATTSARRLWKLPEALPSPSSLKKQFNNKVSDLKDAATQKAKDVAKMAGEAAEGLVNALQEVVDMLTTKAKPIIDAAVAAAKQLWEVFETFEQQLTRIFDMFKPIKPDFGRGAAGLALIMVSKKKMGILVDTVLELFGTSTALEMLGGAVHVVSDIFGQVKDIIFNLLDALDSLAKKVGTEVKSKFNGLLTGINFDALRDFLGMVEKECIEFSKDLKNINDVLGPMLHQLKGDGVTTTSAAPHVNTTKLTSSEEAKRNEEAIKGVVPTWRKLEAEGIKACPKIMDAMAYGKLLGCRIAGFISAASKGVTSALTYIKENCACVKEGDDDNPCGRVAPAKTGASSCPKVSLSAGIKDTLSENAGALGKGMVMMKALADSAIHIKPTMAGALIVWAGLSSIQ